jgi:hypothetical protein
MAELEKLLLANKFLELLTEELPGFEELWRQQTLEVRLKVRKRLRTEVKI